MEQRLLGKSGLSVSVLSFGTMTVGGRDRFQHMGNLGVAETSRMLDICSEAGVTVIDTADMYSFGGAEEILGEALQGKRQQFVIVTKVFMRVGKGAHDIGLSRKHIVESCEGSLRRLRTDYLDVYMCHEPDQFVPVEETLRAFDDLVSQGKVRYIACSNHSAWHVMKALAASERHSFPRYIAQQVNYSLLARDVEHEMVPMGLDQGVGMMAWSPLHFGLLSGKFRRDARPSETRLNQLDAPGTVDLERLYRIVDVLTAIAQERGVSPAQVALNWVMNKPCVDTVILGARNEEQLRDNLAAAAWRLSVEEMSRLDEVSATPEPYPYWHQHKFGLGAKSAGAGCARSVRREPLRRADGFTTRSPRSARRPRRFLRGLRDFVASCRQRVHSASFCFCRLITFTTRKVRAEGARASIGLVVVLEALLLRIPVETPLELHRHVMEQAGGAGAVGDFDGRDRLLPRLDACEPVAVVVVALGHVELVRADHRLDDLWIAGRQCLAVLERRNRIAGGDRLVSPGNEDPALGPSNLMPLGNSPLTIMWTPLA